MNEFIIDLNYISLENDNNQMKYYLDNFLIPINSIYKFYYKPYYKNNPYKFRDFHTEDGFIKLLNNKLEENLDHQKYTIWEHTTLLIKTRVLFLKMK